MYDFEDNAAVTATLERLAGRVEPLQPLTVLLQRQLGAREARWMHLLSGAVADAASDVAGADIHARESRTFRSPAASEAVAEVLQRLELLEETALSYEERLRVLEDKLAVLEERAVGG
jgi:uncharacterized protein YceH (UPF0502 family)